MNSAWEGMKIHKKILGGFRKHFSHRLLLLELGHVLGFLFGICPLINSLQVQPTLIGWFYEPAVFVIRGLSSSKRNHHSF